MPSSYTRPSMTTLRSQSLQPPSNKHLYSTCTQLLKEVLPFQDTRVSDLNAHDKLWFSSIIDSRVESFAEGFDNLWVINIDFPQKDRRSLLTSRLRICHWSSKSPKSATSRGQVERRSGSCNLMHKLIKGLNGETKSSHNHHWKYICLRVNQHYQYFLKTIHL